MPIWHSRTRRSRASCPENCNAVREAAGGGGAGEGSSVANPPGLPDRQALAGDLLPNSSGLDGHRWNHKRVHRVYCELRLNLPRRTKRRVPQRVRQPLAAPATLNGTWALDFMHDNLCGGRRFRTLTVIDEGHREGLAIEIGTSIPSTRVVRVIQQLIELHGRPAAVRIDNGPELTAEAFVEWCQLRDIQLRYIQPGKPDRNAYIERFNRSYREEVLGAYAFESIEQVRMLTDEWLPTYNEMRPHDSLGRVPPLTFLPRPNRPVQSGYRVST